ncbi:hypothetical protein [Stenotrophomonas pigmentata]|uniref:hypothetical protein n=1 Tax=Stenotrophomonas pigmentata TaxID=3055080 RepID=UPI0026EF7B89|nr:hypothetical protein [Stenotrophomonas sp. 610A2]
MENPDAFDERAHDLDDLLEEAERFEVQKYERTLMFQLADDDDPMLPLVSLSRIREVVDGHLEAGGAIFIGGVQ